MSTTAIYFTILVIIVIAFSPLPWTFGNRFFKKFRKASKRSVLDVEKISIIQDITTAIDALIKNSKGASIIIDTKDEVNDYLVDSEYIDALVSSNLIITIFEGNKTPLHDGAIVIRNNRIEQASSYITKLSEKKLPRHFGTRHRSALGVSEVTSSIIIVLSEERSKVTIFYQGKYEEILPKDLFNKLVLMWIN